MRIKVLSDKVYTKEQCNTICTSTKGCVQFNIGQEAPYLGNCDLYKSHFCTFANKEQKKYHVYKPSLVNQQKCQFNWPQGNYRNQCNDTVGWTSPNQKGMTCADYAYDFGTSADNTTGKCTEQGLFKKTEYRWAGWFYNEPEHNCCPCGKDRPKKTTNITKAWDKCHHGKNDLSNDLVVQFCNIGNNHKKCNGIVLTPDRMSMVDWS